MNATVSAKKKQGRQPVARSRPRPALERVMARPRFSGGNHTRISGGGYERQADEAAARVLRGDEGVARILTPAPAASFAVPASRGEPLPHPLRRELEQGFGADLSAVRVHRDAPAAAAARAEEAGAFTSGRDIYFSAGAFAPSNEAGRELVAHEVAHVLQQTGRRGSDGGLRATDVEGSGDVQRTPGSPLLRETAEAPSLDEIKRRHRAMSPRSRALASFIAALDRELAQHSSDESTVWNGLQRRTNASEDDTIVEAPPEIRAFALDVLKRQERFEGALRLLRADPELQTTFLSLPFYLRAIRGTQLNLLPAFWQAHSFFEGLGPERYLHTLRIYFFGPTMSIPNLANDGDRFEDRVERKEDEARDITGFVENELFYVTLEAVKRIDRLRLTKLREFERGVDASLAGRPAFGPAFVKWRVASRFRRWAADLAENERERARFGPEVACLLGGNQLAHLFGGDHLALAMSRVSRQAESLWSSVSGLSRAIQGDLTLPGLGVSAREVALQIGRDEEFAPLRAELQRLTRELFATTGPGRLPPPNRYEGIRARVTRRLTNLSRRRYEGRVAGMYRAAAGGSEFDALRALKYGWIVVQVTWMIQVLRSYRLRADVARVAAFARLPAGERRTAVGGADIRIAHRIRVARAIHALASQVGWETIGSAALAVLEARQPRQVESQLALLGDWEPDTGNSSLSRFADDFHTGYTVAGWEPLTAGDVHTFFLMRYQEALSTHIQRLLTQEQRPGFTPGPRRQTILRRTLDAVRVDRPQRFVVREFECAIRPGQSGEFGELILRHMKTRAFLAGRGNPPKLAPHLEGPEVFLWVIPPIPDLIQRLQDVPAFNQFIYSHEHEGAAVEGPAFEAAMRELREQPWQPWWLRLSEAIQRRGREGLQAQIERFREQLRADAERVRATLVERVRAASIHERPIYVDRAIRPVLEAYNPGGPQIRLVPGFERTLMADLPNLALRRIDEFAAQTSPPDDRQMHMLAILLEESELLKTKLISVRRYDVIVNWLGRLQYARAVAARAHPQHQNLLRVRPNVDLARARRHLSNLIAALSSAQVEQQRRSGIEGAVGGRGQGALRSVAGGSPIVAGAGFTAGGVNYTLVEVQQNFVYHPQYGAPSALDPSAEAGFHSDSILEVNGTSVPADRRGERVLFVVRVRGPEGEAGAGRQAGVERLVREQDDFFLTQFARVVEMQAIVSQLEGLAELIESAAEAGMELAELVPGMGWAVMATRLFGTFMSFLHGGEFAEIVELVRGDPLAIVRQVTGRLRDVLDPTNLLGYLLFAHTEALASLGETSQRRREDRPVMRRRRNRRLARIVQRTRNLGVLLVGVLARVQTRVRHRMEGVQYFVLSHPTIARMMRWAAENIVTLWAATRRFSWASLNLFNLAELGEEFRRNLQEQIDEVPARVTGMVQAIDNLEIPTEIVPLDDVVALVIEIVVDRLGRKAELAARGVVAGLQATGLYDRLTEAVAERLRTAGADPNIMWRQAVDGNIRPALGRARNELRTCLLRVLGNLPFFDVSAELGRRLGNVQLATVDEFPDAAPFFAGSERTVPMDTVVPLPGAGRVLEGGLRADVERRFGHDFGHVRVHTGAEAGRVTGALGVEGLTTGSHVFLKSGLSPHHGAGARVFHHELTHVLQQTGDRPLGREHSTRPVMGKPGGGLRYNPAQEASADRVAQEMGSGRVRAAPVDVGPKRDGGVQPSSTRDVIERLLGTFSRFAALEEGARSVREHEPGTRPAGLDSAIATQMRELHTAFFGRRGQRAELRDAVFDSPFNADRIEGAIVEHIRRHSDAIQDALPYLAREHQRSEGTEESPQQVLDVNGFEVSLARFIYGLTGILLRIHLRPGSGRRRGLLDDDAPIRGIRVLYVHLPGVQRAINLWRWALENTFGTLTAADRRRYRISVRAVLNSRGPGPDVWQTSRYAFRSDIEDEIRQNVRALAQQGDPLDPGDLPPAREYIHPDLPSGTPVGRNIGLRIGLHADDDQRGPQRDSHHIIQFLLLDYFGNTGNKEAFPLTRANRSIYPGLITNDRGVPQRFEHGSTPIDIAGLHRPSSGRPRGGNMPAILISRLTHRTGRLHVRANTLDDSGQQTGARAPAGVIQSVFQSHLEPRYVAAERSGRSNFEAYKREVERQRGPQWLRARIYRAMRRTYRWMHRRMMPRLRDALIYNEVDYYNDVACLRLSVSQHSELPDRYRMTREQGRTVFRAASSYSHRFYSGSDKGWA